MLKQIIHRILQQYEDHNHWVRYNGLNEEIATYEDWLTKIAEAETKKLESELHSLCEDNEEMKKAITNYLTST